MAYIVGVAMVVAALVLLEFGRRYHKTAAANLREATFFAGEFMSLVITILLSGGLTTLIAEFLTRMDLASAFHFALSLATVAVVFMAYLKLTRSRRRVPPPAIPLSHA
jgi:Na+-driven multidrug efflux pump